MIRSVEDMIVECDPSIFAVHSATSEMDKRTLLQLQNIVREKSYNYLEVGSYKGGTLLPHLVDSACAEVVSVDSRPGPVWDERGRKFNDTISTKEMLHTLASVVSPAQLLKLRTIESGAAHLIGYTDQQFDLAFIDAEHTNTAVVEDFLNIYPLMRTNSIVAFHDANLVTDGLCNLSQFMAFLRVPFDARFLASHVGVMAFGTYAMQAEFQALPKHDAKAYIENSRVQRWAEIAFNVGQR